MQKEYKEYLSTLSNYNDIAEHIDRERAYYYTYTLPIQEILISLLIIAVLMAVTIGIIKWYGQVAIKELIEE